MPHNPEPINGGESPLASSLQPAEASSSGQLQPGTGQLDGGPAPAYTGGQLQQNTVGASQDASGVAPMGGLVTSAGSARG